MHNLNTLKSAYSIDRNDVALMMNLYIPDDGEEMKQYNTQIANERAN
jgi:hypothetical protein